MWFEVIQVYDFIASHLYFDSVLQLDMSTVILIQNFPSLLTELESTSNQFYDTYNLPDR